MKSYRKVILQGWIASTLIILIFLLPWSAASAHPADMYSQDQSIQIAPDTLLVNWKLNPGPMLAGALWDAADQNHDGSISPQEAQAWVTPYVSQWSVMLDGQPITRVLVTGIHWPTTVDLLQSGDSPVEIQFVVKWPASLSGQHILELHNNYQEAISLNWFSLSSRNGISFDEPEQTNGLLKMKAYFLGNASGSLQSWESGKPHVPGLTGALSNMAVNLANSDPAQSQSPNQASPITALTSLIRNQQFSLWFLAGAFLLSLALGSLHALTPGHSKTLVAAYLVGSHGRTRDAVFLGSVVTLTHTGSVLLLGLITLVASRYILPTVLIPWLEIVSGLFIVGFGLHLLIRRGRSLLLAKQHNQEPGPLHHHDHLHTGYAHPEDAHHEHDHRSPSSQVTRKSLLTLGISGGLVPCPDAIAILLVAVAVNRIPFGLLLIVGFSMGLALVLIGIGIMMVQGVRLLSRNDLINRFSTYAPVVSAVVVLGLGIGLTLSALNAFPSSLTASRSNQSPNSQPAAQQDPSSGGKLSLRTPVQEFDLKQARIIYLSPDSSHRDQIFMVSLSGSDPISYTRESSGIEEFNISPDQRTILYTVLNPNGETSIKAMNRDGTQGRLVLDCPNARCGGPVWSPDGQKLIYERRDYSQSSVLPLFTLWWLDLTTGETKPVFQDQELPGYSPRFSPDGQWLSYISPSNNTIQIYNLKEGGSLSIPNRTGMPEIWSPTGASLLLWDFPFQGGRMITHLYRYDLASRQKIDLGGSVNQQDYWAAWAPDGQWIAIARDKLGSDGSSNGEQVWLVRPDGTQGHILLDEVGVIYSDLIWSPDSKFLLYGLYSNQSARDDEIWIFDTQTGGPRKVISSGHTPALIP